MAPTASRFARPACIALTGGNGYKSCQSRGTHYQRLMTYEANGVAEGGSGGKSG